MIQQTPVVYTSKTKQKNKKLTFNKQWSDAHFASFVFYYCCTKKPDYNFLEEFIQIDTSGFKSKILSWN